MRETFKGIFFTDRENQWIDNVVARIRIKIAASVPGRAHFGRWAYAPESKQWQSAENPFAPPPTWEWVTDLFAGQQEFNRWQKTLTRSNLTAESH